MTKTCKKRKVVRKSQQQAKRPKTKPKKIRSSKYPSKDIVDRANDSKASSKNYNFPLSEEIPDNISMSLDMSVYSEAPGNDLTDGTEKTLQRNIHSDTAVNDITEQEEPLKTTPSSVGSAKAQDECVNSQKSSETMISCSHGGEKASVGTCKISSEKICSYSSSSEKAQDECCNSPISSDKIISSSRDWEKASTECNNVQKSTSHNQSCEETPSESSSSQVLSQKTILNILDCEELEGGQPHKLAFVFNKYPEMSKDHHGEQQCLQALHPRSVSTESAINVTGEHLRNGWNCISPLAQSLTTEQSCDNFDSYSRVSHDYACTLAECGRNENNTIVALSQSMKYSTTSYTQPTSRSQSSIDDYAENSKTVNKTISNAFEDVPSRVTESKTAKKGKLCKTSICQDGHNVDDTMKHHNYCMPNVPNTQDSTNFVVPNMEYGRLPSKSNVQNVPTHHSVKYGEESNSGALVVQNVNFVDVVSPRKVVNPSVGAIKFAEVLFKDQGPGSRPQSTEVNGETIVMTTQPEITTTEHQSEILDSIAGNTDQENDPWMKQPWFVYTLFLMC